MSRMIRFLLFLLPLFVATNLFAPNVYSASGDINDDVRGDRAGNAEIQVLDVLGQPLEGAFVTLYSDHGRTIETTVLTDVDGKVNFGKLERDHMSLSVVGVDDEYKHVDGYAIYDAPVRPLQISLDLNDAEQTYSCEQTVSMKLEFDEQMLQTWQHEIYVNGIKQDVVALNGANLSVCSASAAGEKAQILVVSTSKEDPTLIRYGHANEVEIKAGGSIAINDISLRQWGSDSQDSHAHFISSHVEKSKHGKVFKPELNANPEMELNASNELVWKVSGTQPVFTTAYFQDKNSAEYMINWEIKSPASMSTIPMPRLPKPLAKFSHTADTKYIDVELEMTYSPDYQSITQMSELYMDWLVDGGNKPILTEEFRSVSLFSSL